MIDKPILYLSDISLIGRCSSTVALPIFSVLGIEATLLPSLILSSHTMFESPFKLDLSSECESIIESFERLDVSFSSLFIGYLSGKGAFSLVERLLESKITKNARLFVDPIFADNGRLYSSKTEVDVDFYSRLISRADVIFPNITEAKLLCSDEGLSYRELSKKLLDFGAKNVVLTGIEEKDRIGVLIDGEHEAFARKIDCSFPGTGDMLSSIIASAVLRGISLQRGAEIATKWISGVIEENSGVSDRRLGLPFEKHLPELCRLFGGAYAV